MKLLCFIVMNKINIIIHVFTQHNGESPSLLSYALYWHRYQMAKCEMPLHSRMNTNGWMAKSQALCVIDLLSIESTTLAAHDTDDPRHWRPMTLTARDTGGPWHCGPNFAIVVY